MNLRPSGYEPDELPDCSTPQQERNYDNVRGAMQACDAEVARIPRSAFRKRKARPHGRAFVLRLATAGAAPAATRVRGDQPNARTHQAQIGFHARPRPSSASALMPNTTRSGRWLLAGWACPSGSSKYIALTMRR